MSEVKIVAWQGGPHVGTNEGFARSFAIQYGKSVEALVYKTDYDAAQFELAALREELAVARSDISTWRIHHDRKSVALDAAEQRNAELVELLKGYPRGVPGFAAWADKVTATLKPTESGAESMKVKVIKATSQSYWYANKVGQEFEVEPYDDSFGYKAKGNLGGKYFNKNDVEIIKENVEMKFTKDMLKTGMRVIHGNHPRSHNEICIVIKDLNKVVFLDGSWNYLSSYDEDLKMASGPDAWTNYFKYEVVL